MITGAYAGLGRALTEMAVKQGHSVILVDKDPDVARLAGSLGQRGLVADLSEEEDLQRVVMEIDKELDVLILNAAATVKADLRALEPTQVVSLLTLNVTSVMLLAQRFLGVPAQRQRDLVLVSSSVSGIPTPGLSTYGPAKAFVSSLGMTLAIEQANTPVRVHTFEPSGMRTRFQETSGVGNARSAVLMDPSVVADAILTRIASSQPAAVAPKVIGFTGRAIALSAHFLPRGQRMKLLGGLLGSRR